MKLTKRKNPKKSIENRRMLPEPRLNILIDFTAILEVFQDNRYIGELRQRWSEIKKLRASNILETNYSKSYLLVAE